MTKRSNPNRAAGADLGADPGTTRSVGAGEAIDSPREQLVPLPAVKLFATVAAAALIVAGSWAAAAAMGIGGSAVEFRSGMWGIGLTGVLAMAGIAVLTPWKPRAMADWMTMWLGATVFRVLVTPAAAFLLYSAPSLALAAKPLGLSVALTYMATLFVEAAVLARHLNGFCPPRSR